MKKLFLTGIAALFLATGAPAEEPPGHQLAFEAFAKNVWRFNDYKKCTAQVEFTIPPNPKDWLLRTDLSLANDAAEVVFDRTHLGRVLINNSGPDVRCLCYRLGWQCRPVDSAHLDSEQFRFAPRTCRVQCGRLSVG